MAGNKHKDCKYYDGQGNAMGLCLAHPPVFTVDRVHDSGDPALWHYPTVSKDGKACGEFVQKEE